MLYEMSRDLPNMGGRLGEIGSDPKGHLSQLEARLFQAGLEEELQQAEIHAWRQTMEEQTIEAPKVRVDARVEEDTEVQKLTALIDEKRNTLAVAEAAAAKGSDDQRSQDLRREVAELEGSLKDLRTVVRERVYHWRQRGTCGLLRRKTSRRLNTSSGLQRRRRKSSGNAMRKSPPD